MIYFIRGGKPGIKHGVAEDHVRYVDDTEVRLEYFRGHYFYAYHIGRGWKWMY